MSNMESRKCPQCGAPVDAVATACKYCGADIAVASHQQVTSYQAHQQHASSMDSAYNDSGKSKIVAGILAILLGGLGIHKFYLGRIWWGIIYILFVWTYIPAIVGLIEGIIYLTSSDEKFYNQYVKK